MRSVTLPGGRTTSEIGFGMASMAAGGSMRDSRNRLEAAFEMGVRHFDTAPGYGLGGSEKVLGEFAKAHRGEISVTTKFGGWRPSAGRARLMGTARSLAKRTIAHIPGMRARLIAATQAMGPRTAPQIDAASLEGSLKESLAAIGVERIDLFLLHEVARDRLADDAVELLERTVKDGRIGAWGVGGTREVVASHAGAARVVQTDWSVLSEPFPAAAFGIAFGSISGAMARIEAHLQQHGNRARWSEALDADLNGRGVLPALLLRAAVRESGGMALFTSRTAENARTCLGRLAEASDAAADRLRALARDEIPGA